MLGVLSFISRMTEHGDLVTGAIKSRIAFLQLLIDCLFSSNHWLAFNLHQLQVDLCDSVVVCALTLEADGLRRPPYDSSHGVTEKLPHRMQLSSRHTSHTKLNSDLHWPYFVWQHASTRSMDIDQLVQR